MKFLGYVAYTIGLIILAGFVLTQLWGWFIAPFFGLPELTIAYAIGITITARMVIPVSSGKRFEDYEAVDYVAAVLLPFLLWGVGYVVFLFI